MLACTVVATAAVFASVIALIHLMRDFGTNSVILALSMLSIMYGIYLWIKGKQDGKRRQV